MSLHAFCGKTLEVAMPRLLTRGSACHLLRCLLSCSTNWCEQEILAPPPPPFADFPSSLSPSDISQQTEREHKEWREAVARTEACEARFETGLCLYSVVVVVCTCLCSLIVSVVSQGLDVRFEGRGWDEGIARHKVPASGFFLAPGVDAD